MANNDNFEKEKIQSDDPIIQKYLDIIRNKKERQQNALDFLRTKERKKTGKKHMTSGQRTGIVFTSKQKIAQFKKYRKLSKQLKELDLRNICAFGEFAAASGKISKLKTKWMPNVKPRPEFWELADYPCIINHQGDKTSQLLGLLTGEPDVITFYCPKYSSDAPCTNETCMHWANNQHCFNAEKAWLECSEKYEAVKKEYDTVRGQIFRHDNGR